MEENEIQMVESTKSPEFSEFKRAISHSSIIGLACHWKPFHQPNTFPPVLLLQIACQLMINSSLDEKQQQKSNIISLLDLSQIHLPSIYDMLKDVFINPHVIKLGFHFKQDLIYLSSTFHDHGGHSGFDTVVPVFDIENLNQTECDKSLSSICQDLLGFSLSKELQCSDWSVRPLTPEQKTYAALDALCLVRIFNVLLNQGSFRNLAKLDNSSFNLGLEHILRENDISTRISGSKYPEAVENMDYTLLKSSFKKSSSNSMPMDYTLFQVAREYGDRIELTEIDRKPRTSKKKGKKTWQGPAPWDPLLGGDGCPKFMCDIRVSGLVKPLRTGGVDAGDVPYSKKGPEPRELIDQAIKEK